MALDRIALSNLRNHADTRLDGTRAFNLLVGENGAGKTNVLEALSLLAPGRGLRRAALAEIAGPASPGFALGADLLTAGGAVRLGTATAPERPNRRTVQVSGAEKPALALGEWLSMAWLTPAQDRLFADTASARRRFLDRLVAALEPGHARDAARAEAALRERNRLLALEDEPDRAWLAGVEAQFAAPAARVAQARARTVAAIAEALEVLPEAPFARPLLAYQPGGPLEEAALTAALAQGRRRDRAAQRTLIGPHRDELAVTMAGKSRAAADCSTGEQKAMLIALTLAHAALLSPERPAVLLLDEVAAHLDPLRRDALFSRLRAGTAQVWLTGTEAGPFAGIVDEAAVWRVSAGTVERVG